MIYGQIAARQACLTVIDFETTGAVAGHPVEPWQVGIVRMRAGQICVAETFESFLYVGARPFNPHAPGRHAQLREELSRAPRGSEIWPALSTWVTQNILVAHNVGVERTVLTRLAPLHRFGPWLDTLKLARHAYPNLRSYALTDVLNALGLSDKVRSLCREREPHDALFDAFACAALLEHLLGLPTWEHVTVSALAEA